MSDTSLEYYMERYLSGQLTPQEAQAFQQLLEKPDSDAQVDALMLAQLAEWEQADLPFTAVTERVKNAVQARMEAEQAPRARLLWRPWLRYAAAILTIVAIGVYLWAGRHTKEEPLVKNNPVPQKDIAPGKEGAVLTLADGRQVLLDSAANGVIATQAGAQVVLKNGQLAYATPAEGTVETVYNTMSTPKGRQFHIVLPDGSGVWLNAATTIRYPAVFNGTERMVELTGEAYFEVARNPAMPFKIKAGKATQVEVLGTSFNINAYDNEDAVKTTLLEGAVMVAAQAQRKMLMPGDQAQVDAAGTLRLYNQADIRQVMAWKNGYFDFNNADLRVMMRQLERWYDIRVQYEDQIPDVVFKGKMDSNVPLSAVLQFLKKSGISTRLEDRTLFIYH